MIIDTGIMNSGANLVAIFVNSKMVMVFAINHTQNILYEFLSFNRSFSLLIIDITSIYISTAVRIDILMISPISICMINSIDKGENSSFMLFISSLMYMVISPLIIQLKYEYRQAGKINPTIIAAISLIWYRLSTIKHPKIGAIITRAGSSIRPAIPTKNDDKNSILVQFWCFLMLKRPSNESIIKEAVIYEERLLAEIGIALISSIYSTIEMWVLRTYPTLRIDILAMYSPLYSAISTIIIYPKIG